MCGSITKRVVPEVRSCLMARPDDEKKSAAVARPARRLIILPELAQMAILASAQVVNGDVAAADQTGGIGDLRSVGRPYRLIAPRGEQTRFHASGNIEEPQRARS